MSQLRDSYSVKLLILYTLNRLSQPITLEALSEAVQVDDGFTYFDVVQALSDLVASGHIEESGQNETVLYTSTAKGKAHGEIVESDLPYSLRRKAGDAIKTLVAQLEIEKIVRNVRAANESQ